MTMTEIQKPVRRSSLVMLSLFAAAAGGSGVAQAQECIAREKSFTVRAEGITEAVGTIELRCTEPTGFGFGSPAELEVTVELNTRITSVIDDDRVVAGLSYTDLSGTGVTDADFAGAKLSEDGTTITWEITSADVNLGTTGADGFQVTIGGIKANASAVGDGEDITAVVRVGGTAVHSAPLKVADVMLWRGIPEQIRSDNGPEFIAKELRQWLANLGTGTLYIEPARPQKRGFTPLG